MKLRLLRLLESCDRSEAMNTRTTLRTIEKKLTKAGKKASAGLISACASALGSNNLEATPEGRAVIEDVTSRLRTAARAKRVDQDQEAINLLWDDLNLWINRLEEDREDRHGCESEEEYQGDILNCLEQLEKSVAALRLKLK